MPPLLTSLTTKKYLLHAKRRAEPCTRIMRYAPPARVARRYGRAEPEHQTHSPCPASPRHHTSKQRRLRLARFAPRSVLFQVRRNRLFLAIRRRADRLRRRPLQKCASAENNPMKPSKID